MKRPLVLALLLCPVLGFAAAAGDDPVSAAVIPMTLQDLVNGSELCLRGQVVDAQTEWTADGAMIQTTYTLARTEALMGSCPDHVKVRVPGGTLDGITIRSAEAPAYALGEDVVVFTRPDASAADAHLTYGWFQGKYTLLGGVVRELPATSYDELRSQILQAVENK